MCSRMVTSALALSAMALGGMLASGCAGEAAEEAERRTVDAAAPRPLPPPLTSGDTSLEAAIEARRSVRDLDHRQLTNDQLGQLLWAAQGLTDPAGLRAAPSAGATYPLEVYAVTADGVARYAPTGHALIDHLGGDRRPEVAASTRGQDWVANAPLVVVLVGIESRTAARYGDRAERYVLLEAGHAAQNLLLQATALGLAGTPVGAFDDDELRRVLDLSDDEAPLYVVPIGHPVHGG